MPRVSEALNMESKEDSMASAFGIRASLTRSMSLRIKSTVAQTSILIVLWVPGRIFVKEPFWWMYQIKTRVQYPRKKSLSGAFGWDTSWHASEQVTNSLFWILLYELNHPLKLKNKHSVYLSQRLIFICKWCEVGRWLKDLLEAWWAANHHPPCTEMAFLWFHACWFGFEDYQRI